MNQHHTWLDRWLSILFLYTEKLVLVGVGGLALVGIGQLMWGIYQQGAIRLEDLLMIFIFIEIMAMANVYFLRRSVPFTYPMFIAVTALSRLIVLQGKEGSSEGLIYESGAILLISFAILVIRFSQQFSTDALEQREDRHE
ncbi:phosphate-starvation-inducible PsiE family protein [Allochromatium palmeri]|uniref:Protein PsiE n=1 Tax=Allochromatium palmeri TaxID=231048 RepID=A0A6N8E7E5_9GAMM|nr:phosphate-starvation-inducible PsiE family protein [Allochromatium palmeri]MTW20153.1 phosphate-starvation-inducible E [Allochromatium palmeri]